MLGEIPINWMNSTLGDVVEYGKTKKVDATAANDDTWILELEDIEKDTSKILKKLTFADRKFKSTKNVFKKGDVLYGKLRPYLNKVVIADDDGVCTTEIIPMDGMNNLDNGYLFYWLKTSVFSDYVTEVGYGVNMPRLGTKDGQAAPFILAPLAEQKEIARRLDDLLAQVDTLKARLDNIPAILKRFRQSVLAAAVSGKLTEEWRKENKCEDIDGYLNAIKKERIELKKQKALKKSFGNSSKPDPLFEVIPENWSWVTFEDIAENSNNALKAGPFGSALKKSDCVDSGFKIYGQEQVIAGDENLITYYIDDEKFDQLKGCAVKSGDILISLVGTIGKILVLSKNCEPGIINPRLVKLALQADISRGYVKSYLDSPIAKNFFKGFSHGGTMDILNLGILKQLPIALPPLEEQTEIVRRVEQLFAFADKIEEKVNKAQTRVDKLTQSILKKAFQGDLTAEWREQNPDLISGENSAEALLERIKTEREKLKPVKKTRRKTKA